MFHNTMVIQDVGNIWVWVWQMFLWTDSYCSTLYHRLTLHYCLWCLLCCVIYLAFCVVFLFYLRVYLFWFFPFHLFVLFAYNALSTYDYFSRLVFYFIKASKTGFYLCEIGNKYIIWLPFVSKIYAPLYLFNTNSSFVYTLHHTSHYTSSVVIFEIKPVFSIRNVIVKKMLF